MKCPVCKNSKQQEIDLHVDGFYEGIVECEVCGTTWAINHGAAEVIRDSQEKSFLEASTECVEGNDYIWAA